MLALSLSVILVPRPSIYITTFVKQFGLEISVDQYCLASQTPYSRVCLRLADTCDLMVWTVHNYILTPFLTFHLKSTNRLFSRHILAHALVKVWGPDYIYCALLCIIHVQRLMKFLGHQN